jgi:ubiquinone biosynthesis protein COQ9
VEDKEAVRRGTTLFALPHPCRRRGARDLGHGDAIWTALGDTSDDLNWYTKRATLSGVYSATVLYWLGDESPEHSGDLGFPRPPDRDVMQIEKVKAQAAATGCWTADGGPDWLPNRSRRPLPRRRTTCRALAHLAGRRGALMEDRKTRVFRLARGWSRIRQPSAREEGREA